MIAATFDYLGEHDPETSEELARVIEEAKQKVLNEVTSYRQHRSGAR